MLSCIPAYGRDYTKAEDVQKDLDADKDFEAVGICGHGYVNKSQLLDLGEQAVAIRYRKCTMQRIFKLK